MELETKIETTVDEKVTLYKVCEFGDGFPFDEEVMMLTVEDKDGKVRRFRFNSEIYSIDDEEDYMIELQKAKKTIGEKSINTDGFEVFLISHN